MGRTNKKMFPQQQSEKKRKLQNQDLPGLSGLNLVNALSEWMRAQDAKKPPNRGLSAEQEYQEAKDELQAIMDMRESLLKSLTSLNDLRIKKGLKLRKLSENLSPLLSLKGIGVLDNVIGNLDEPALYCLEEAAGPVKGSSYVHCPLASHLV